jgi:SagB-type dehydrogenase family enzyme
MKEISMDNRDIKAAWTYHNGTKHPGGTLMNPHHPYDPMRHPLLFKRYEDLDPIPVSLDPQPLGAPALAAIATSIASTSEGQIPDLDMLARILHFSVGITKTLRFAWGEMQFRAAACTGALYHIELYLVCGALPGLEAGVYHVDPSELALRCLRKGDHRGALVDATADEPAVANAPALLVYTDVFWRNAIKYQAREYRHAFWDSGTIIANSLATAAACSLPGKVVTGFIDASVNQLLDLDTYREVALVLVPIGYAPQISADRPPAIESLALQTVPISDYEIDFPAIRQMHEASSLTSREETRAWREATPAGTTTAPAGALIELEAYTDAEMPHDALETVIIRRGSTRQFSPESITFPELSTILEKANHTIPTDVPRSPRAPLNQLYLIVNAVDGLQAGTYVFHRELNTLELLRQGDFRHQAGQLALGQALAADASVNVFFLTNLWLILDRLGNRGYRAAQLEASITAGRFYLGAYALRLGATGLTFYDDAVIEFFSPHAQDKSVMFLVALGKRARRRL